MIPFTLKYICLPMLQDVNIKESNCSAVTSWLFQFCYIGGTIVSKHREYYCFKQFLKFDWRPFTSSRSPCAFLLGVPLQTDAYFGGAPLHFGLLHWILLELSQNHGQN